MNDELDRLAAADPVAAAPPPVPAGPPGRSRRTARRVAGAAGVLALGGLVAALIVTTPSGDDEDPPPAAAPLDVLVFDRPQVPLDRVAPVPARVEGATLRRVGGNVASVSWYAARERGRPRSVCLLSVGPGDQVRIARCGPIARGLVAGSRRVGPNTRLAGIVPDGITSVTVGARTIPVRENAFTLTARSRPDVLILQGDAASRIPGRPGVAVLTPTGDPPAVAVAFDPDVAAAAALGRPGTLRQAATAIPFTVLAPDSPPRGAPLVRWTPPATGGARQVELRYLRTSGPGITVTERAAAPGTPDRRPTVVRDTPDGAVVRTVLEGTTAEVRGPADAVDEALAVAASLSPVAP